MSINNNLTNPTNDKITNNSNKDRIGKQSTFDNNYSSYFSNVIQERTDYDDDEYKGDYENLYEDYYNMQNLLTAKDNKIHDLIGKMDELT